VTVVAERFAAPTFFSVTFEVADLPLSSTPSSSHEVTSSDSVALTNFERAAALVALDHAVVVARVARGRDRARAAAALGERLAEERVVLGIGDERAASSASRASVIVGLIGVSL
jgi:hypothetical protein